MGERRMRYLLHTDYFVYGGLKRFDLYTSTYKKVEWIVVEYKQTALKDVWILCPIERKFILANNDGFQELKEETSDFLVKIVCYPDKGMPLTRKASLKLLQYLL